jgi:hypothetical protein
MLFHNDLVFLQLVEFKGRVSNGSLVDLVEGSMTSVMGWARAPPPTSCI